MKAIDVMTPDVVTIRSSATVAEAIALMQRQQIRALIVGRRNQADAYGIITATDIVHNVAAHGKDPAHVRVYEIMTKPCIVVNPNLGIDYVARLFSHTGIHCAPVIQGQLLGMISMTDILMKAQLVEQPQQLQLDQTLQDALDHARAVCASPQATSKDCFNAWVEVEELQAELAYQQEAKLHKTALEEFCATNPDLIDAELYDSWCGG